MITEITASPAEILVVDDLEDDLALLTNFLQRCGFKVHSALGGHQGLETLKHLNPELILLDIAMPDLSGFQVIQQIKKQTEFSHIPVIFISSHDSLDDKVNAFKAGGVDYICKPFYEEEVLVRVNTHIGLARAQQALSRSHEQLEQKVAARTAELDASYKRLDNIASRLPGMIYEYRLNAEGKGGFSYISEGIREIYQLEPDAVRDTDAPLMAMLSPEDREYMRASMEASAHTLQAWQAEYQVYRPDGSTRWLRGNALPHRGENGDIVWHGFVADITERRQDELSLISLQSMLANLQVQAHALSKENAELEQQIGHKNMTDAQLQNMTARFQETKQELEQRLRETQETKIRLMQKLSEMTLHRADFLQTHAKMVTDLHRCQEEKRRLYVQLQDYINRFELDEKYP